MNRELKFRAWDRQKNEMLSFIDLGSRLFNLVYESNYAIQQYTGRKDINNQEIYEGDIVEFDEDTGFTSSKLMTGIVEWGTDHCEYMVKSNKYSYGFMGRFFKVIGNAFENPELLKYKPWLKIK